MCTDENVKVSVIFATYNRADIIDNVLNAWDEVNKNTKYKYEIICSDDESSDNTVELLKQKKGLPLIVLENSHGGASKARNAALEIAKGELIIFTGDDIFPYPDYVNDHYESYLKYGSKVSTLGQIDWHENIEISHLMNHITNVGCEQFGFAGLMPYQLTDLRHFYTSNISVAKSELDQLGEYFNLTFDKYGFEDIELGYRLSKNGIRILYNPDILVYHHHEYHSVDKFCRRQLSAGDQLVVFEKLHPDLYNNIGFENTKTFAQIVTNYIDLHKGFSFSGFVERLYIQWMKRKTERLERKISKKENMVQRGLCSLLYSVIFQYYMLYGWAKRIVKDRNIGDTQLTKCIIDYMNSDYAQLFWDTGADFNETESVRVNVVGSTFKYMIHLNNCKRLRFDPLNKKCRVKNLEVFLIDSDGNRIEASPDFTNAGQTFEKTYSFMNTDDSQIYFNSVGDEVKSVEISADIKGPHKLPFTLWMTARYIRNIWRERDLLTKVCQPFKPQVLIHNDKIEPQEMPSRVRIMNEADWLPGHCDYILLDGEKNITMENLQKAGEILSQKYYDYIECEEFVIVNKLIVDNMKAFEAKKDILCGVKF